MAGDVDASRDPYALMAADVVEQALETGGAGGMSEQAHVKADRHHLRLLRPFPVEHVERVSNEGEPIVRCTCPTGVLGCSSPMANNGEQPVDVQPFAQDLRVGAAGVSAGCG